ncbi:MAG: hypothetical protein AAF591_22485 [Verrucomicrobiota bacterium]
MSLRLRTVLCCLAAGACFPLKPSHALNINWGSAGADLKIIQSDGSGLTDPPFSFELGSFGASFTPDVENIELWITNWKPFDASPYAQGFPDQDPPVPPNPITGRFGGGASLLADQTSDSPHANGTDTFGPNEQAYVFIRNSDTFDEDAEWALYTRTSNGLPNSTFDDAWIFPDVSPGPPGIPLAWGLNGADTVVVGAIQGSNIGGGHFTDTSSNFFIRTHSATAPAQAPEPAAALLATLGAGLLTLRHRSL